VRKESGAPGKLVQRQSLIAAIPANLNGVEANAVFRRILTKSSASEQQAAGIPLAELARVLIPPNILSQVKIPSHFITPGDLESLIKALSVLKGTVEPQLPKVIIERIDGLVSFYKSQLNRTPQPVSALRQTIISIALSQVGAVEQKKGAGVDPNDPQKREFRVGGDRLLEYFTTANPNPTGLYHESDVKHVQKPGEPDNVIDWCGIFALWAYKSAGMNVGVWKVGTTIGGVQGFKPVLPSKVKPGDVGIRKEKEHQYLVLEVNGDNLVTIEGNTNSSGSAIGGEIAVQRIRTISGTDYGFLRPNDLD
jgi:hypothetical protein